MRAHRRTHTDTHTRANARFVSRRENRIYSPSHCLNGRSRRNANFLCHGTIESAYTRGRNNVTSAKRDRKMKYRDVECSSVYGGPLVRNLAFPRNRNCRRVRLLADDSRSGGGRRPIEETSDKTSKREKWPPGRGGARNCNNIDSSNETN